MAQLETVKVQIDLSELDDARKRVRRVIRDAQEANRTLAQLEERLIGLGGRLAEHGIRLEVED